MNQTTLKKPRLVIPAKAGIQFIFQPVAEKPDDPLR